MRADVAATDDRKIEIFGQPIDRVEPAFLDQIALGLDRIDEQRRQEHVALGAKLARKPPRIVDRVRLMHCDDAAEQRDDLAIVAARRPEARKRSRHRAAPADADRIIVRDGFGQELAEREADVLCQAVDVAIGRSGHDDRLVEAVGALQLDRKLDAVADRIVDPDLHLAALHRLVEQADDGGAADAELLGDILLRQALIVV